MAMSARRALAVLGLALVLATTSCADNTRTVDLEPITFMAGFSPQANLPFVGVYVADANGYFVEEGIEITIEHSAGGGEHLQLLASGNVDITTQDAAVVLQRRSDPGLPLVSIALVGQRGQQAFVAMADSGMTTPKDWQGHTVGFKGTPPPDLFAIMDAAGADPSQVDLVNVGFDPRVFTEGRVDVYPVFKSNEPDTIESWGFELISWDAADFGVPTLGLTYVATESTVADRPDALRSFMAAVIRGIAWADDNREDAIDIVLAHTGADADRDHQRFMLDTELAEYRTEVTEEHGESWQTESQWQDLHDMLLEYDAIAGPLDVARAFTTDFLPGR